MLKFSHDELDEILSPKTRETFTALDLAKIAGCDTSTVLKAYKAGAFAVIDVSHLGMALFGIKSHAWAVRKKTSP